MSSAARPERLALPLALAALLAAVAAAPVASQTATVTSLADSGPGSLREAIGIANSDGVPTSITFAPGLAGGAIALASPLPALSEAGTTIDGDFGGDCVPDIAIDGQWLGAVGLHLGSNGNRIAGLAVHSFDCPGCGGDLILVWGSSGNLVECNYLGTDLSGTTALGTSACGVKIIQGGSNNTVRDNRILFNGNGVCVLEGSADNTIGPGNEIAFGAIGVGITENAQPGYPDFAALTPDLVQAFATVDFTDDCDRFHRVGDAVLFDGSGHPFTEHFGMRLTGEVNLAAPGDYLFEIPQLDDEARLILDASVLLEVSGPGPHTVAVPSLAAGSHTLELDYFEGGGFSTVALQISGPGAATFSTGAAPPAGCAASQPGLCGELFQLRLPTEGNRITQNAIHDNSYLGIALNCCCSPLANDSGDADIGANTALNHPEIVSVVPIGGGLYSTSGDAGPDQTIEIFASDGNPSGFGEGQELLGTTVADPVGNFSVGLLLPVGTALLTATATDAAGNTSEFGPNFTLSSGQDEAAVDGSVVAYPGDTVEIPVFARDVSLSLLGLDRPAGERIQSLAYKVTLSPASSVASKTFARAGITAGLTPDFEVAPTTATTASYVGHFDEATNPIPFTLDGGAPGDQVLKIVVTISAAAPAGTIALVLDPATTEFANQAGTLAERMGNGWLALVDGEITVLSNAAKALRSYAVSSSAIQLAWDDPNANETGFRLERSTDGASWATVTTLGPDATSYLDATGLASATLYYHRLVTLTPADGHASNLAAASTFPAVAAEVCVEPIATPARSYAFSPRVAWGGGAWGVAWWGREGAIQDEIWFQRFHATTLAPLGPPTRVAASASPADRLRSDRPVLAWSDAGGGHWGVAWSEGLAAEPGTPLANSTFFALLAPDGSVQRGGVRISNGTSDHPWEDGVPAPLLWDGTNWGIFELAYVSQPRLDLVYRRLDEDGDVVLGPVAVLEPSAAHVADVAAAWNGATSKYGLAWNEIHDDAIDLYFQVMEESTGALEGSPTHLDDYVSVIGTYGFSVVADGSGWAVAWSDFVTDPDLGDIGISWLRRFDATGAPLGPAIRLSDDPPADGGAPLLASKPGGGFAAFLYCFPGNYEVCRIETDAAGAPIGSLTEVSDFDGAHSILSGVAGNGSDFLVVFGERGTGSSEIAASLVPATDFSTPGAPEPLTAGHDPTSGGVGNSAVVPLGAGFAAVWIDATSGTSLLQARTWDGAGATVATLAPLDSEPTLGRPGVVGVGDTFAVAWRSVSTANLWFARYDAAGSPIVSRTSVSTLAGFRASGVAMAFSGEAFGLLWARNGSNGLAFLAVAPDGSPLGSEVPLPVGNAGGVLPQIQWTGLGWAIVWVEPDPATASQHLRYALLAADGTPLVGEASIATVPQGAVAPQPHLLWTGADLFLAWSELGLLDPPLDDVYLVRVNLDGSLAYPPVTAVSTPLRDQFPALYWTQGDARLHLLHQPGGLAGEREIELLADGTLLPGERWWTSRSLGGVAWNGITLGYVFGVDGNLYFQTGACVTSDASPPPCPDLAVASFDDLVRLDWPAVSDPESGIFRYHVYRDGLPLGKTWPATTQFDDGGYGIGATHLYEVRALDGAWRESAGCSAVSFSTTPGDANGDGFYTVADIFYLINFFFADGPPPAGNADANGDNAVTVTDIFYMINNLFSGGPPPAALWSGAPTVSSVRDLPFGETTLLTPPVAPSSPRRSRLVVGNGTVSPGETVRVPIYLADLPDTPLGPDRPYGERVQAIALTVRCAPCDDIASLALEPAGALLEGTPFFETRPSATDRAALLATYDEAGSPLFFAQAPNRLLQRIATLVVQVSPSARSGATLDLRLDPGTTVLSNQSGTLVESAPNGWLELSDGRLRIVARPTVDVP